MSHTSNNYWNSYGCDEVSSSVLDEDWSEVSSIVDDGLSCIGVIG